MSERFCPSVRICRAGQPEDSSLHDTQQHCLASTRSHHYHVATPDSAAACTCCFTHHLHREQRAIIMICCAWRAEDDVRCRCPLFVALCSFGCVIMMPLGARSTWQAIRTLNFQEARLVHHDPGLRIARASLRVLPLSAAFYHRNGLSTHTLH